MTLQSADIALAREFELITACVAARLDRLTEADKSDAAIQKIARADEALRSLPGGSVLDGLIRVFGGTDADRAVLMTCIAPDCDPRLLNRYHQVTGRGWATEWLASILFARPGQVLLTQSSALMRWRLITARADQPGEPPALSADPAIRAWMSGFYEIPTALAGRAQFLTPPPALSNWPVKETAARMTRAFDREMAVLLSVSAMPGSGRASFAGCVACAFDKQCILVDPEAGGSPWTRDDTTLIQRLAIVSNAALVWRNLPPDGEIAPIDRSPPAFQALTLLSGTAAPDPAALTPFAVDLPVMMPEDRRAMIAANVPTAGDWSDATRALLATREALTPGAIAQLARIAPQTDAEALEATNQTQSAAMGGLAQRMSGDLRWDDLVLPDALSSDLRDLAYEAQTRKSAWAAPAMARLFARERGLIAVFHGPPGTGKTMAAQVLAHEMGVDLYRIDCTAVVSKYIGETSKNLHAIFARARQIDAVLFFDEAEALFAKRTDVRDSNDRHSNADTTNLLQLIEGQFEGTALLATNRKSDMDSAFLRRIRYSFEFPRPAEDARIAIWERAAEALELTNAKTLAGLWPVLGASLDITGAQIKTTLLAAYFAAQRQGTPLDGAIILRAAERELMKEGRALGARERERIRAYA